MTAATTGSDLPRFTETFSATVVPLVSPDGTIIDTLSRSTRTKLREVRLRNAITVVPRQLILPFSHNKLQPVTL